MSADPTGPRGPRAFDPAQPKPSRVEAQPTNPFLAETMAQIEQSTIRNPLAAVAIAAGAGFVLSKLRADKAAWHLGLFPAIAGAAAGFLAKR